MMTTALFWLGRGAEGSGGQVFLAVYTTFQFERQLCMGGNLLRQNDSLGTGQQPAFRILIHVFTGLWGHVLMNLMTLMGMWQCSSTSTRHNSWRSPAFGFFISLGGQRKIWRPLPSNDFCGNFLHTMRPVFWEWHRELGVSAPGAESLWSLF